jgi:hypothetical protein
MMSKRRVCCSMRPTSSQSILIGSCSPLLTARDPTGGRANAQGFWRACAERFASAELAADDLRDALMAHVEDAGDVGHRQAVSVGIADGPVAIGPKPPGQPAEFTLPAAVLLGKGCQVGSSLR